MNYTSFVQIDDSLAFNPGHITRVQFGYERMTITRVTVSFVDGVSSTLTDDRLTKFLEWWTQRAIVVTKVDSTDVDVHKCFICGKTESATRELVPIGNRPYNSEILWICRHGHWNTTVTHAFTGALIYLTGDYKDDEVNS